MKTYSVKDVASLAKVGEQTVRKWINTGKLPAEKFPTNTKTGHWIIREEDIPAFLRK